MMGHEIHEDGPEAVTVTRETVIHAAMIRAAFVAAKEFDRVEHLPAEDTEGADR